MQTQLMSLFALTNDTATHTWESLETCESAIRLSVSSPLLPKTRGRAGSCRLGDLGVRRTTADVFVFAARFYWTWAGRAFALIFQPAGR